MIAGSASPTARPTASAFRRWAGRAGLLSGALVTLAIVLALLAVIGLAALPAFGHKGRVIASGSMGPAIPAGSIIISRPVAPATLAVGDVITFRRSEARVSVTHRIVAVREERGQRAFVLKGDANHSPDPNEVTFDGQVDKVVATVPHIGCVIGFSRSTQGLLVLVLAPALGLGLLQLLSMGKGGQRKEDGWT